MIALSMGVERIVEILKETFPSLAKTRKAVLHAVAASSGMVAALLIGPHAFLGAIPESGRGAVAGALLLGLMASGGSVFWNHVLSILEAVRTTKEAVSSAALTGGAATPSPAPSPAE